MVLNLHSSSLIFLADLTRVQSGLSQAERQISSGFKVEDASDAPDQISNLLQLEANLSSNKQVSSNLGLVKSETDSGESALNSVVQLSEQAISLGAQGANGTQTAQQRQVLAQQVQGIQQQLVSISNTTVAGRYIFSGDLATAATYQLDATQPNGVARLAVTTATRQIQDANGSSFAVSKTAQDIFDHRNANDSVASDNLFAAVNSLSVALTNNDTAGIASALTSLHTASDYVNSQQAFYGNVQNRIASAVTSAQSLGLSLQSQISGIRDADITAATLQLTQGQTEQQAALAAEGKRPRTSLFDFLA